MYSKANVKRLTLYVYVDRAIVYCPSTIELANVKYILAFVYRLGVFGTYN